jgi:hypothetical protein
LADFLAAFLPPLRLTVFLARVATTNSFSGFSILETNRA